MNVRILGALWGDSADRDLFTVHYIEMSPNDPNVDLMDVNQDGLPDVLITRPECFWLRYSEKNNHPKI
jgi:hypothetical protein